MTSDIKTEFMKKLSRKFNHGNVVFAVCKPSAVHIGQTYAVFITRKAQPFCFNACPYNLVFTLADNSDNTIQNFYVKENALRLDEQRIKHITIDTGLYQLNPSLRAVGIHIAKKKPDSFLKTSLDTLFLFINSGKTFKPLFHREDEQSSKKLFALRIKELENSRPMLRIDTNSCSTNRSESTRTIALGEYHNNFRYLIITSKVIDTSSVKEKNGCAEQKIATTHG